MTGSVMAMAGIKAALTFELSETNYSRAERNTINITEGIRTIIEDYELGWSVATLGARFDIWFAEKPGVNAAEAFACHDGDLYEYVFSALVNRGYIMSPYWNILGSVSPYISETECSGFLEAFEGMIKAVQRRDAVWVR
jgi:glutamate-1-semialdehyde 2,1-aminomutase